MYHYLDLIYKECRWKNADGNAFHKHTANKDTRNKRRLANCSLCSIRYTKKHPLRSMHANEADGGGDPRSMNQ